MEQGKLESTQGPKFNIAIVDDASLENSLRIIRLGLDTVINSLRMVNCSEQVQDSTKSCLMAKNWMGKMLQAIGTANPYPNSHDPKSPVIEKQAEHDNKNFFNDWSNADINTQTGRVKFLRSAIQEVHNTFRGIVNGKYNSEKSYMPYEASFPMLVLTHLDEAKMWLDWELDPISIELEHMNKSPEGDQNHCDSENERSLV